MNTFVSKSGHLRFFQKLPNIIFGTFSHFYQSFEHLRGQIYNHNILYVPSVIAEMWLVMEIFQNQLNFANKESRK